MKAVLALLLMTSLAGCALFMESPGRQDAPADRLLTTDRGQYSAGAPVTLRLFNDRDQPLGYNLCVASLEVRADGRWVDSPVRDDRYCTMELRLLPPGQQATYPHQLPRNLPRGTYRFTTRLELMQEGSSWKAVSNVFEVR